MSPKLAPIVVFQPGSPRTVAPRRVPRPRAKAGRTHVGDVQIRGKVVDSADPEVSAVLPSIEILRGVTAIVGDLIISGVPRLQTLDELRSLDHVSGHLIIRDCPNLRDVSGILGPDGEPRLEVGGLVHVSGNGVPPNRIKVHAHGDVVVRGDSDLLKLGRLIRGGR